MRETLFTQVATLLAKPFDRPNVETRLLPIGSEHNSINTYIASRY